MLDALPVTANGKIDRRALPAPDLDAQIARRYVAPRNATEETLCQIFAQALGLERLGVEDDFFLLGGNSLSAMQVVSRIGSTFNIEFPLRALFTAPTISGAATTLAAIERARGGRTSATMDGSHREDIEL
ncbi:phosphopantetheine-binding protein [Methylocapsa aurea]|uniref:phosphopantetheine-binding protein n=1 Tax=Methylocapsa aurea TaxID=663610 RepID=UPI003D18D7BB